MPVLEYSCMPIGEFIDLISVSQIISGAAREAVHREDRYITNVR